MKLSMWLHARAPAWHVWGPEFNPWQWKNSSSSNKDDYKNTSFRSKWQFYVYWPTFWIVLFGPYDMAHERSTEHSVEFSQNKLSGVYAVLPALHPKAIWGYSLSWKKWLRLPRRVQSTVTILRLQLRRPNKWERHFPIAHSLVVSLGIKEK